MLTALVLFGSVSDVTLMQIYDDLDCEHGIVHDESHPSPIVPGLTPAGFARWITIFITAYPASEVPRLQEAVERFSPMYNVDDPKTRFPSNIPRELFPQQGDEEAQEKIEGALPLEAWKIPYYEVARPTSSAMNSLLTLPQLP